MMQIRKMLGLILAVIIGALFTDWTKSLGWGVGTALIALVGTNLLVAWLMERRAPQRTEPSLSSCPLCGAGLTGDSARCPNCGADVAAARQVRDYNQGLEPPL